MKLRESLGYSAFRRLLAVRLVSQTGDGLFQVGLATLLIFNPTKQATAWEIAVAFAILLAPFTLVGPFAGPLLDRWRRRNVLVWGNAIRLLLAGLLAVLVETVGDTPVVYVFALATLGVNRFLLAGLSASLPHTLPLRLYLIANSITPTLGSLMAAVGGGLGALLALVLPAGWTSGGTLVASAAVFGIASALAAMFFDAGALGPHHQHAGSTWRDVRKVVGDMVAGARYLHRRRSPVHALGAIAAHRFFYGFNFVALIVISRHLLADPSDAAAGFAQFAIVGGVSFVGNALAVVGTPVANTVMSAATWVRWCLAIAAVSQFMIATTWHTPWLYIAAVILGFSAQGSKIAVDTIVQAETEDRYRGRAFAFYDMAFNTAFICAALVAALVLPTSGWSRPVFVVAGVAYCLLALAYARTDVGNRNSR
ncbi:MFS family permease [Arcanobacterium wilhelmae]|uniref:MFS family permease n=1 Tax=Arcanobacterium wilhelmae TaxID=1803177 RepID=A0ABT9NBL4_9ACTO|nr:MFS transporter [Arcanobacterium wilhelmae]MDP9800895.1 MFS family permease [Arcanobacterium wilhelmae]WFN90262.1 MFS transporter [Arcanobacterium wilhelmae]